MKVHLVKTPEYKIADYNEVFDFLSSFCGPLEFSASHYNFNSNAFTFLKKYNEVFRFEIESDIKIKSIQSELGFPLSWQELFSLCKHYRDTFNIGKKDFVILLTQRKNSLNWFSVFDNCNNAFVHCDDWELYSNASSKFPIAYEIVANILRSMMNLSLELPNPYVHEDPVGCVNDLCSSKKDIVLKLRTADVCAACMEKILAENINDKMLKQVLEIFEGIRLQLLTKQGFKVQVNPSPLVLNERNQLLLPSLGNLEIKLTPLFKSLYIFYLRHTEGVRLSDLNDFKSELLTIYERLSLRDDSEAAKTSIDSLVYAFGNSFSQKKSKINRTITDLLGEPLAHFYRIEGGPGEAFKINLPNQLIDIRY